MYRNDKNSINIIIYIYVIVSIYVRFYINDVYIISIYVLCINNNIYNIHVGNIDKFKR